MPRREIDAHFGAYVHIPQLPRADEALKILKKLASIVKPLMRKRNWRIRTLSEFLPDAWNLLGLNVNKTETIFIRLRYSADPKQFLPYEDLVDTLLHELSHVVWSAHDRNFHALWDELREEYYALKRQGYTGEGFLSDGRKLGGKQVPPNEARRRARAAAEKRKTLSAGSGQKLGGAPLPRGTDMRKVISDAVTRRTEITDGCGSGNREIEKTAEDEAKRLGFRTKAEMDDADQLAIAVAIMEGEKEAEELDLQKLGAQSGDGLIWSPEKGLEMAPMQKPGSQHHPRRSPVSTARPAASASRPPAFSPRPDRPASLLATDNTATHRTKSAPDVIDLTSDSAAAVSTWTCDICTLVNDPKHLCCDACGIDRPESSFPAAQLTGRPPKPKPLGWNCGRCGTFMESQWWTCSACGSMKTSS